MFISESQLGYKQDQYIDLMDVLPVLEDDESYYDPAMVPIVENSNYGRGMIRIEDINEFAEANGIYDMGYAISTICESSGVHPADLLFTIKEENLYLDENLSDIVIEMVESGIPVATVPISDYDPIAVLGNYAINFFSETGSDYYLDAFANGDWFCIAQAITEGMDSKFNDALEELKGKRKGGKFEYDEDAKRFTAMMAYKTEADKLNTTLPMSDFENYYKSYRNDYDVDPSSGGVQFGLIGKSHLKDHFKVQSNIQNVNDNMVKFDDGSGKFDANKAREYFKAQAERSNQYLTAQELNQKVEGAKTKFGQIRNSIGLNKLDKMKAEVRFDGKTFTEKSYDKYVTKLKNDVDNVVSMYKIAPEHEQKKLKKTLQKAYENYSTFKSACEQNFKVTITDPSVIEQARNILGTKESAGKEAEKQGNPNAKDIKQKEGEAAIQTEGTPKTQKEAEGFFTKVKSAFDSGRVSLAKGIAWVRRKIEAFEKWLGVTPDSNPVKKVIGWLVGKLRGLMQWLENKVRPGEAGTKD